MITDEYIKEVNAAYWAEEDEMKLGIHPSQIRERIEQNMIKNHIPGKITMLTYPGNGIVQVHIDHRLYGNFEYIKKNDWVEINIYDVMDMDELKGFCICYLDYDTGLPKVVKRCKTRQEVYDKISEIFSENSGWLDEEKSAISVENDYDYALPR